MVDDDLDLYEQFVSVVGKGGRRRTLGSAIVSEVPDNPCRANKRLKKTKNCLLLPHPRRPVWRANAGQLTAGAGRNHTTASR
jgi:hypothetical protein